jgi:hypothetical protein
MLFVLSLSLSSCLWYRPVQSLCVEGMGQHDRVQTADASDPFTTLSGHLTDEAWVDRHCMKREHGLAVRYCTAQG